jgi:formylglycine-generating enzyme required for sulfatase activity
MLRYLVFISLVIFFTHAAQASRLALVIGNGDYNKRSNKLKLEKLRNPVNDANDVAAELRRLGFKVILKTNVDRNAMRRAIRDFSWRLYKKPGGVGLFYFSGHGFQYQNDNYLVPLRADIKSGLDIEDETIKADYMLRHMKQFNSSGMNMVILDACRDSIPENFFKNRENKGFFDGLNKGLTNMQAPRNSLIAYSTAPNTTSWGGLPHERNSVYTKHLLAALQKWAHLSVTDLFIKVRRGVTQETINEESMQVPWESVSLMDTFKFAKSAQPSIPILQFSMPIIKPTHTHNTFVAGKVFRDKLKDGGSGPEMVWIPAGSFRMGDIQGGGHYDEKPVHRVSVNRFAMGKYEVTFAEYDKFAEATGRSKPDDDGWGRGNRPVINVSWHDATAYAKWLSKQTGKQYRLPTEAEWEYAARAGTETKYWWGNTASHEYANYGTDNCCYGLAKGKDRWKYTSPVGSFSANQFGLYDTLGNVWEWTCSEYDYKYNGKEKQCVTKGNSLSLRGGSWDSYPWRVRSANRNGLWPAYRYDGTGFRVSRLITL